MVGWKNRMSLSGFSEGADVRGWMDPVPRDQLGHSMLAPFEMVESGSALAQGIVDTIREPLVVLDEEMRVVTASRSFYHIFRLAPNETRGQSLFKLGGGEWDIARLRLLLGQIIPEREVMEDFEVEHEFSIIGKRTMLLNARKIFYKESSRVNILLSIEDITEERLLRREKDELLEQKDTLLAEIQHRVANSLQIIASVVSLKSRRAVSEEARRDLEDVHSRIMSVASVQRFLHRSVADGFVDLLPYLSKLCEALSYSIIGDTRQISISVKGGGCNVTARKAENIGLIVTELVINSIKHAFNENTKGGEIVVSYDASGDGWRLSVADNGTGKQPDCSHSTCKSGLGTGIVNALASQLDASIETTGGLQGTIVTVGHKADTAAQTKAPIQ